MLCVRGRELTIVPSISQTHLFFTIVNFTSIGSRSFAMCCSFPVSTEPNVYTTFTLF